MRRHAKASTAGSTQRQAKGLGRFFRGADATSGASPDPEGSGAPAARRVALPLSAFAAILAALALLAALAAAATPVATTGSATNLEETAARLNGTVNPEGALLEECKFEYGLTESYGQTEACDLTPAEIGSDTSNVEVKTDITGLTPATAYHFRLVAKNSEGTANGADETFKTLGPPVIAAEWAESVSHTEATIKGEVNPEGLATTYKFEWGPTATYGDSTSESNVGSDNTNHKVSKVLSGLQAGASYHYRIVATNSGGTTNGPDRTFTTYTLGSPNTSCTNQAFRAGFGSQLPDCRAYEMVSPVDKNNGDISWLAELLQQSAAYSQSSLTGDKLTYSSYKAFGDALSEPWTSQYIATRHEGEGWTTHSINPPERKGIALGVGYIDREYRAFSPDLSTGWIIPESGISLAPGAAEEYVNIYKRDNLTDSYQTLTLGPRTTEPNTGYAIGFDGSSEDGMHALFVANESLTPEAPPIDAQDHQLYEWVNGNLRLVSILPNGEPNVGNSSAGSPSSQSVALKGRQANLEHAISDDGSRIFWTASDLFGGEAKIYVRINGAETVPVSESVTTKSAYFWMASADGSKAIFTVGNEGRGELYEFDVDTETPTLIAHNIAGVSGASEDASYIYFVSEESLDAGATAEEQNLYVYHEGAAKFIATLASKDVSLFPSVASRTPDTRNTKVTPDGRHLLFLSRASLTGYDNTDSGSGEAASEVYRYDADSGLLNCISCNPSGAQPSGSRPIPIGPFSKYSESEAAAWIPTWESFFYAVRSITDDGSRVFFNGFDALLPQDNNGRQDVYEWEAPGTGDCTEASSSFSAQDEGCLSLLSSGESPVDSEFVDANPSGNDVFLRTKSSLLPQDPGLIDVYDARVGGGFPTSVEPTPCVGDACQGAPEPPNDATPASASFKGAGNPTPRKANRRCRASKRHAGKGKRGTKSKHTKRCTRNNRRAGR